MELKTENANVTRLAWPACRQLFPFCIMIHFMSVMACNARVRGIVASRNTDCGLRSLAACPQILRLIRFEESSRGSSRNAHPANLSCDTRASRSQRSSQSRNIRSLGFKLLDKIFGVVWVTAQVRAVSGDRIAGTAKWRVGVSVHSFDGCS
jgi:hypothetical protein